MTACRQLHRFQTCSEVSDSPASFPAAAQMNSIHVAQRGRPAQCGGGPSAPDSLHVEALRVRDPCDSATHTSALSPLVKQHFCFLLLLPQLLHDQIPESCHCRSAAAGTRLAAHRSAKPRSMCTSPGMPPKAARSCTAITSVAASPSCSAVAAGPPHGTGAACCPAAH